MKGELPVPEARVIQLRPEPRPAIRRTPAAPPKDGAPRHPADHGPGRGRRAAGRGTAPAEAPRIGARPADPETPGADPPGREVAGPEVAGREVAGPEVAGQDSAGSASPVVGDQQAGDQQAGDQHAAGELVADRQPDGVAGITTLPVRPQQQRGSSRWERQLAGALAFVRRRITGDYDVDEFGFDPELTEGVLMPPLRQFYERWFRVEAFGMHNVPDTGGALVVANHSGTLPVDALMTTVALHDHHPAGRQLRPLGADLVFKLPMLGAMARKAGGTLACNPDAERLLSSGELVGVWPEGFKGIGKPFKDRYKLQRFGRGGFVSAALRTGVPIIPCSIVGAEEIYPLIGDLRPLARLLGAPYFPVTPLFPWLGPLGMIPLPSKWYIEFGEPIDVSDYGPGAADDPMLVFNLSDQVRETIQQTLYRLLSQRRNAFLG
jgi:1-acyl-sn-glycerol-3-phosphate acyltransferase